MYSYMTLSKANLAILLAYERGYRIINGEIINDKNKVVPGYVNNGYKRFSVIIENSVINVKVHRFIAYQKYGDKIFTKGVHVRHLDNNPLNNKEDNIEIGSGIENSLDRNPELRLAHAYTASLSNQRFDLETIKLIKVDREAGMSFNAIARKYNAPKGTVRYLIKNSIAYNNPEKAEAMLSVKNFKSF